MPLGKTLLLWTVDYKLFINLLMQINILLHGLIIEDGEEDDLLSLLSEYIS